MAIVGLLKRPDYHRLLHVATSQLMDEIPTGHEFTSYRAYVPASLVETLCARVNPNTRIPIYFPVLLRPLLAALPSALYPDVTHHHWTHPADSLCRGDPLFNECCAILLGDAQWAPDIHSLLPIETQQTYVLLARILWKNQVHAAEGIFQKISTFLPPVILNTSKNLTHRTVLEISEGLGALITEELWSEVTLRELSGLMSYVTDEYISPAQLPMLHFGYPDVFELQGVMGVPELRTSGQACLSIAFETNISRRVSDMIKERIVHVENEFAVKSLGLTVPSKVAMTTQQRSDLTDVTTNSDPDSEGIHSAWLQIQDDTRVEEVLNPTFAEDIPDRWD